jgi:YidC/Oxa1 family membrane protein insertase
VSTAQHVADVLPVLGSTLGRIFQPLYQVMAWMLAAFYALVPNFAVAITLLTVVVMAASAPLTIKATRSALAMQRLQPELKKLREKYKGDRVRLNDAMLALYRDHGVSPLGGLLPLLLQVPVFVVLLGVIRGLTHTIDNGRVAAPLYIGHSVQLVRRLRAHPGQMHAFGINLASSLLSSHGSWLGYLPYGAVVLIAIGLQYLQTRQINSRTPSGGGAPQAQALQRFIPLVYALIYVRFPAGVNVYFVVSGACRIVIQALALGPGLLGPARRARHRLAGGGET